MQRREIELIGLPFENLSVGNKLYRTINKNKIEEAGIIVRKTEGRVFADVLDDFIPMLLNSEKTEWSDYEPAAKHPLTSVFK